MNLTKATSIAQFGLAFLLGAASMYGAKWWTDTRRQDYLALYAASWNTYFTTETIADLRDGNISKAEKHLQNQLNARIQTIGMILDSRTRYRKEYLEMLNNIKAHRDKYPYRASSESQNMRVDKVLSRFSN